VTYVFSARREEKLLEDRFGDAYRVYKVGTGMVLPSMARLLSGVQRIDAATPANADSLAAGGIVGGDGGVLRGGTDVVFRARAASAVGADGCITLSMLLALLDLAAWCCSRHAPTRSSSRRS
jgi:hypothetical protein